MATSDLFSIIRKNIFTKDNVVIFIISTLLLLSIYACINTIIMANLLKNSQMEHSDGRSLLISVPKNDDELRKIKNIKHVEVAVSQKYSNEAVVEVNYKNEIGNLSIKPILNSNEVNIIKGNMPLNDGEMVCPYSFIITNENYNLNNYNKHIKKGTNFIGEEFYLKNIDNLEYKFKIVGSFENKPMDSLGTCYVSIKDFDQFKSDIDVCDDKKCYEYSLYMIRVDKYKNMNYVEKELEKLGFSSFRMFTFNENFFYKLTNIPIFIAIIILTICLILTYSFYKKKEHNNQQKFSIMKSIGYSKTNLIQIELFEAMLTSLVGIALAITIYTCFFIIVKSFYLKYLTIYNIYLTFPIITMLVISLIYMLFICIIVIYLTNRKNNKTVLNLQN